MAEPLSGREVDLVGNSLKLPASWLCPLCAIQISIVLPIQRQRPFIFKRYEKMKNFRKNHFNDIVFHVKLIPTSFSAPLYFGPGRKRGVEKVHSSTSTLPPRSPPYSRVSREKSISLNLLVPLSSMKGWFGFLRYELVIL